MNERARIVALVAAAQNTAERVRRVCHPRKQEVSELAQAVSDLAEAVAWLLPPDPARPDVGFGTDPPGPLTVARTESSP